MEYAWDLEINQLGYAEPLSDDGKGGGDEIDVYLNNLGNVYGLTYPDNSASTSSSAYIELENDFSESVFVTKGYDALKVTTAHEFFHAIHFRYYITAGILTGGRSKPQYGWKIGHGTKSMII